MRTHSQSFTSGGRGLGEGPRKTTLAALLAAGLAWGFLARDPWPAAFFGLLLLLPREFGLFRWMRGWTPLVAFGVLGICLAWPVVDRYLVSGHVGVGFARLAMLFAVWRSHFRRLAPRDHVFLVGISFLLVLLSLTVSGPKPFAPLALWGLAAVCALFRLHLAVEEQRVLDLARVRGFQREDAEEIGGRDGIAPEPLVRGFGTVAVWIVVAGFLLGWATPFVGDLAGKAWAAIRGGNAEETRPPMPEIGDGPPEFAIPAGARAPVPFGDRLARDEFVHRLEEEENLALLHRRVDRRPDEPDLYVRMDVYDHLAADMRWIRARASRRLLEDAEDGRADGRVTLREPSPGAVGRDYLVPPGTGLVLPVVVRPFLLDRVRVMRDGAGNLFRAPADVRPGYRVVSSARRRPRALAEAGEIRQVPPEFSLLPGGIDAASLREITAAETVGAPTPAGKVAVIVDWLGRRAVHHEADRAFPDRDSEAETAPLEFDPLGFLVTRRWGRNIDFATALALLLRAEGIPCRLATGYREGAELPEADFRIYRSWHAWAWVEVPFSEWGWTPVDATPEGLSGLSATAIEEVFEAPPEERPTVARKKLEEAAEPSLIRRLVDWLDGWISSLLPGSPGSSAVGRFLSWLAILVGAGLLFRVVVAGLERASRVVARRRSRGAAAAPHLPFYERLLSLLSRHGMRRRRAQTPLEFARRVVEEWGPEFGDVARLTNAWCAHRYGLRTIPAGDQASYLGRVAALETRLSERRSEARARMRSGWPAALLLGVFALCSGPARGQEGLAEAIRGLGAADPDRRSSAAARLVAAGRTAVPPLVAALSGRSPDEGATEEIGAWIEKLDAEDYRTREEATEALVVLGERARGALEETARTGSPEASRRARRALERIGARSPPVAPEEVEREERTRLRMALRVLARVGGPSEIEAVAAAGILDSRIADEAVRTASAWVREEPAAIDRLLARADSELRRFAVRVLGELPRELARPRLLVRLGDADPQVRRLARRALVDARVVERTDAARLMLARGEAKSGEEELLAILRDCPGYAEAGRLLFDLYLSTGRHGEALALAGGLRIGSPERDRLAARALAASADLEAARARLHDAAEEEPERVESLLLLAEIALAASPERLGWAANALRTASRRAPEDPEVWQRLARVLARIPGAGAEAEDAFLRAATLRAEEGR